MTEIDKSRLPDGRPYWVKFRKTYTIIREDGTKTLVKLGSKREQWLNKTKQHCAHCNCPKSANGWIVRYISEAQGGGSIHICPRCSRPNEYIQQGP